MSCSVGNPEDRFLSQPGPYNKLAKTLTKGTSIPFKMCMLPLIYPHYLCGWFYLQTLGRRFGASEMHLSPLVA